ncbi:MAG: hypothetical protein Q9160_002634 [Pyrenula sp. 1 TL-2023]
MGFRITSWNVNGIRNPFGYQPWSAQKSLEASFDILEADIVVFQETKIQRKDLTDNLVLVDGWDCYWSLPRHKKDSSTAFRDLPKDVQIGGYPTPEQLEASLEDESTIDSEGRCVILEFPAFVLLGVYAPANRDESRDGFRLSFLNLLDARVRNLVSMGKRVILTGDLNIARDGRDAAWLEGAIRKREATVEDFLSTPARRMFNHLLEGGQVIGQRDKGRKEPVLYDPCRAFHEDREGMYTCWETKVNARPGNYGARIDYVLSSIDMRDWFVDANIQEGLMGSDHCPVYTIFKEKVTIGNEETHISNIMNPEGTFRNGTRLKPWSTKFVLPMSGKLIPEFDRRRSIKDMFSKKSSTSNGPTLKPSPVLLESVPSHAMETAPEARLNETAALGTSSQTSSTRSPSRPESSQETTKVSAKRNHQQEANGASNAKRAKPNGNTTPKGQKSLKGFFTSRAPAKSPDASNNSTEKQSVNHKEDKKATPPPPSPPQPASHSSKTSPAPSQEARPANPPSTSTTTSPSRPTALQPTVSDPIATKESWGKLFVRPSVPRCEHGEPCKTMLTKKAGVNCGRSFWMCARPLGPSGQKEKGTQWRCATFIWCSDWNGNGMGAGGG